VASIPPNLEAKSGTTSPQFWAQVSQFQTQVFPSILGFFPFLGKKFYEGCKLKNKRTFIMNAKMCHSHVACRWKLGLSYHIGTIQHVTVSTSTVRITLIIMTTADVMTCIHVEKYFLRLIPVSTKWLSNSAVC